MQVFAPTRGGEYPHNLTLKESILNPKSNFGGLHTLSSLPTLPSLQALLPLSYIELTQEIFSLLHLQCDELRVALKSYESFDDPNNPAPLHFFEDNLYIQELYHGPSRAFKDMALQPLGALFESFVEEEQYLILTATSGDTGPATLESFKNKKNINVVCLYPAQGTSDVQRLQMTTQSAKNLKVLPIIGDFDDAQAILKSLLSDEDFHSTLHSNHFRISAANSVNFGRIAFQIIYHIWGYLSLARMGAITLGEKVKIIIPSGNFGNALGAFYAKLMGIPFEKIIIASNPNNILTDFITTGVYDISTRHLLPSFSPAMDILKSSNIERVLYALYGAKRTQELMRALDTTKQYTLTQDELALLQKHFEANFCTDEQCLESIKKASQSGKIIDPHTANAYFIAQKYKGKTIISSTAEWSKFTPTIAYALCGEKMEDQKALEWIATNYNLTIPKSISQLFEKPQNLISPLQPSEVKTAILQWLGILSH
ncbi:MAG TPA: threonine synthase [Candidatus Helicobacter avistercoris]|nr:threonine synthase [Candidatus Helicobacter avistercoris]